MSDLRALFQLDPEMAFLNHGSFGACPTPVFAVYQEWQRELERQPVDLMFRRAPGLLADARARLAEYLGAQRDDLVFVPNATMGVNIVARSLRLGRGDLVLATDHEYGACDRVWRFLCQRSGAEYRRIELPLPVDGSEAVLAAIDAALDAGPQVLMVSHITSPTALVLPVTEIVALARRRGVLTLIDGAHAPGQVPLDLDAIGADFYTGNCHKWMCTPKGSGFLHVRRAAQHLVEPLVVSWGWEADAPGPSRFVDEQEFNGTRDLAAYLAVPAAIDFLDEHHWGAVRRGARRMLDDVRARLIELPGVRPVYHGDLAAPQMEAVILPPCDPLAVNDRLFREHRVEVPGIVLGDHALLRVSIQAYNTPDDVERLYDALPAVLAAEAR